MSIRGNAHPTHLRLPMSSFALLLIVAGAVRQRPAEAQQAPLRPSTAAGDEARPLAIQAAQRSSTGAARTRYADLGFRSADEAKAATLGSPIAIYYVRLDQLRAYHSGDDPIKLLTA